MNYLSMEYTALKEENLIEFETNEYKKIASTNDFLSGNASDIKNIKKSYTKCGEIYINENDISKLLCILCEGALFTEMDRFLKHVKNCRLKIPTENLEYDPLEPDNSFFKVEQTVSIEIDELTDFTLLHTKDEQNSVQEVEDTEKSIIQNDNISSNEAIFLENDLFDGNSWNKANKRRQTCLNKGKKNISDGIFSCNECDKKYSLKTSLCRHKRKAHQKPSERINISCDICSKEFTSAKTLEVHKKYDHQPLDPFMTNIKSQSAESSEDDLENDKKNKNQIEEDIDPMKCRYCNHQFQTRMKRVEHERIHTGERPFKCSFCEKCFRIPGNRVKHELVHKGIKPHKCTMCDAAFTEKSNLRQHIRRHLGDKKLPCKFCGKLFQQNSERKTHERIHTGEKPYQCSVCGQCFITSEKVYAHLRRHTNVRPFKCNECDKSFYTKQELVDHNVVHTGERPFKCDICQATFPRRKSLKSHMKIHSDKAEYICKICGKGFKQGPGLYCHMKSHGEHLTKS